MTKSMNHDNRDWYRVRFFQDIMSQLGVDSSHTSCCLVCRSGNVAVNPNQISLRVLVSLLDLMLNIGYCPL